MTESSVPVMNPALLSETSHPLAGLISRDVLKPVRSMSQSITVSWSTVETRLPEAAVQVDKLSNHDLILRCQSGLLPDRAAFRTATTLSIPSR